MKLQWFRDQGQGQAAADEVQAIEEMVGSWPVAILVCLDKYHCDCMWRYLLTKFAVNAMTYY